MNRVCEDCGEAIINAGAHYESCVGEICRECGYVVTSEHHQHRCPCDCPPGWQHRPDCVEVTG